MFVTWVWVSASGSFFFVFFFFCFLGVSPFRGEELFVPFVQFVVVFLCYFWCLLPLQTCAGNRGCGACECVITFFACFCHCSNNCTSTVFVGCQFPCGFGIVCGVLILLFMCVVSCHSFLILCFTCSVKASRDFVRRSLLVGSEWVLFFVFFCLSVILVMWAPIDVGWWFVVPCYGNGLAGAICGVVL